MADNQASQPLGQSALAELQVVQSPMFYASSVQILWAGNDCTIVFARPRPGVLASQPDPVALNEPVAIVQLSAQTVKDLSVIMAETVRQHEDKWGAIETEFTRQRGLEGRPKSGA